jgi:retinol dehydrogenase 12
MPITGLLKGKVCLVTGATNGIGKATLLRMAREDADVVILARNKKKADAVAATIFDTLPTVNVEILLCDLSSQASVRKAAQDFGKLHDRLDVLVNAASVFTTKQALTEDGVETMWATNHFGPFLLTNLLLPYLRKSPDARVLTVSAPSSTKIDFDDLPAPKEFKPYRIFGATKSANILFGLELARRNKDSKLSSNVVHPGLIRSSIMQEAPAALRYFLKAVSKSPERAAEVLTLLASSKPLAKYTGRFYRKFDPAKPPKFAADTANQKKLWDLSAKVVKLKTS